jgi:hypothetical protein
MTDRAPVQVIKLDIDGNPALSWSRPHDLLAASATAHVNFFLGTVRPDGRPHAAGIGALWFDGDLYLVSGPETRKSRNLAANPACTISVHLEGIDLVLEGEAHRVTNPPTLERVAELYREEGGWGPPRYRATRSWLRTARRARVRRPGTSTASPFTPPLGLVARSRVVPPAGASTPDRWGVAGCAPIQG